MQNNSRVSTELSTAIPVWKDWASVVKPGIWGSNIFCAFAGYCLALRGHSGDISRLIFMLLGTTLVVAAASMLNNYLDRTRDLKMERTRNRPLPSGRLKAEQVRLVALLSASMGLIILYMLVNPLSALLGFVGIFVYVVVYTMWLKPSSTWSTSIGGISGAMPPMIGYCSLSQTVELGAVLLFLLLFLWQPPHFWALGILKKEEYRAAGYPLLPVVKGTLRTKWQMLPYVISLFVINVWLYGSQGVGVIYMVVSNAILVVWLYACVYGFFAKDQAKWASSNFRISLYFLIFSLMVIMIETPLR